MFDEVNVIGFKTNEFEEKWNSYTKLKHSIFTNSATAGLHIACETFKINIRKKFQN